MKKAAKFIEQEADLSSCDDCEVSEDESDEDDEYDLKDSMIDGNHYAHDESAMALYHKSLKNVQYTKEYMNRPMRPITDDIFSQAVSQTEPSQYMFDSFCVPESDEIIYEKKKKKKKKNKETNGNKLRRLKFLEESQASANSMICLSSSDETEKQKLGNSSLEIFGTNPNENKKKNKKVINSITEEEEEGDGDDDGDDDDLLLVEAETNLSRTKNTPSKSESDVINVKKNDFVPELDSESEDFNNWLSNDIEKPKENESRDSNQPVFSIFNKSAPSKEIKSNVNVTIQTAPTVQIVKNSNWLIVDTSLLASAADVIQNLKKIWDNEKLILQSGINCDFIISQRYALLRFKWSDISAPSNREHVIDRLKKARSLYSTVMLLVQDDRETNLIKTRTKYFDSMLANLTEASFILFSKFKTDEICNQINYLSKTESTLGFGIEFDLANIIETKKRDINFFLSLPNISIINALYACNNYETISKFLNSSIQDLVLKLKINDKKAKQLLRFLNLSANS